MHKSRKRLSAWSALPPYLGGKRRLAPTIFREIDRILPRRLWRDLTFLDGFLGGGVDGGCFGSRDVGEQGDHLSLARA